MDFDEKTQTTNDSSNYFGDFDGTGGGGGSSNIDFGGDGVYDFGNGNIEQSGLMQLHTLPTGATVKIDGATIFGRTNLSRTLSAGDHKIEISRDGYDTWKNTVQMRSGVLLRLYYPRLFLTNRTSETVKDLGKSADLAFYVPSPGRNYIIYAEKTAAEWRVLDIRGDEVKMTTVDLSKVLPGMIEEKTIERKVTAETEKTYKFEGEIKEIRWSYNEENLLVKVAYEEKTEWVLVRLKDVARSVNLSRTFGLNEAQLEMIDSSANQIYVLEKRQLRRIDVAGNVMSRILLDNVIDFDNEGARVIYLTGDNENKNCSVGVFRDDEKGGTTLTKIADDVTVKVAVSNYYDEDYMVWTENNKVTILYGRLPSYDENGNNLGSLKTLVNGEELDETPEDVEMSPGGEYFVARRADKFMTIDVDDGESHQYTAPTKTIKWFDDSMLYGIKDNQIIVWDFDGENMRNLSENIKTKSDEKLKVNNDSLVTVSNANKYIYYLVTVDKNIYLAREQIRD